MSIYEKNLTEDFRLRLSEKDMDFLRKLSDERSVSVSEVVRSIINEYRRSLETMSVLTEALKLAKDKGGMMSNGDTKSDFDD